MARNTSVNVGVNFVPDTTQLDSALKKFNNVDLQTKVTGISGDVLAPFRRSVEELNAAMASGRGENEVSRLMERVKAEANEARAALDAANAGMKAFYESPVNQDNIKEIKNIETRLKAVNSQIEEWNKNRKRMGEIRSSASKEGIEISGNTRTRVRRIQEINEQAKAQGELNKQQQIELDYLREYNALNNQIRSVKKSDLETSSRNLNLTRNSLLANTITPEQFTDFTTSTARVGSQISSQESAFLDKLPDYSRELKEVRQETEKATKDIKKFGDVFAGSFLGFSVSNVFEDALRSGIDFFTQYDETLTRTQMVTGMAREEVLALTESYNELAQQLSSTTKDVAAAQLVFYQQGLTTEESLAMTEASIAISKTGGIEAGEAADRLTSAIRGYQLSAEDAMDVADKMSALDAAAASSVDELTVAMQKSASQARMAGLDLDYYMAYLSTMQEVTREAPENIGTAMKSITSRIQEITDIGKVEEDGTTFSNVAKALNSIGIAALDTQGQLRPLQEILNELGPMWASLDRNHQAYIATVLAGNRQQSRFIALMDNYDRALELVNVSQNSAGENAKQLRAYEDGLESSLVRVQNAWQQLATSLADSDMISSVLDMVSEVIEFLDKIPDGLLRTVTYLTALSKGLKVVSNAFTVLKNNPIFGKGGNGITIGNLFPGMDKSLDQLGKSISSKVGQITQSIQSKFVSMGQAISGSVSNAFNGFSSGAAQAAKGLSSTTVAVQNYNNSLVQSKISQDLQNSTFAESAQQAGVYDAETQRLAKSIQLNAQAINLQKAALDADDPSFAKQIQDVVELNAQYLADSQKDVDGLLAELSKQEKVLEFYSNERNKEAFLKGEKKALRSEFKRAQTGQMSLDDISSSSGAASYIEAGKTEEEFIADRLSAASKAWDDQTNVVSANVKVLHQSTGAIRRYNAEIEDCMAVLRDEVSTTQEKNEAVKKITTFSAARDEMRKGNFERARQIEAGLVAPPELPKEAADGNVSTGTEVPASLKTKKATVGINALKSIAVGSIAEIASEAITGSEDVGEFTGRLTGLTSFITQQFPKLGGFKGFGIAAAITIGISLIDAMTVSVEELEKELELTQEKFDTLGQDISTGESALSTYEELSSKINLSEEEQQQLNEAANQLADIIPDAVKGYDEMGNAIIDATIAQEELNAKKEQEYEIAKRQVKLSQSIGNAKYRSSGHAFITWLGETFLPTNWFNGKSTTDVINDEIYAYNMENADVLDTSFSLISEKYISEMDEKYQELGSVIANSFSAEYMDRFTKEGSVADAGELQRMFEENIATVSNLDWNRIGEAIDSAVLNADADYSEIRDTFQEKVQEILKKAGIEDDKIEVIIDLILKTEVEGYSEVDYFVDNLEEKIANLTDESTKESWQSFLDEIKGMDLETSKIAAELGLLDTNLIDIINSYGGLEQLVTDLINPDTGEMDKGKGYKILQWLYDERNALEGEIEEWNSLLKGGEGPLEPNYQNIRDIMQYVGEDIFPADTFQENIGAFVADWSNDGKINDIFSSEEAVSMFGEENLKKFVEEFEKYLADYDKYIDKTQTENSTLEDTENKLSAVEDKIIAIRTAITSNEELSFSDLASSIQTAVDELDNLGSWLVDLDNNDNVLTGDGIVSLFSQLDNLEGKLGEYLSLESWGSGLAAIADGISLVNGQVVVSENAQEALNQMVQESIRLKMQEQLQNLQVTKADLQNKKTMLQASYNLLKNELERIRSMDDDEYKSYVQSLDLTSDLASYMKDANIAMVKSTKSTLEENISLYAQYYDRITELSQAADPLATYETFGELQESGSDLGNSYIEALEEEATRLKGLYGKTRQETIDNMEAELSNMEGGIKYFDRELNSVESKIKIFSNLADENVDLMGAFGIDSEATESVQEYNEQLERTLTLLEKIEGVQHKIEENDAFRDLYEGTNGIRRGELLAENLRLYEEQFDYYKQLFDMQQEMTNQAAGDLLDSPYGELFTIAENGDIGWATTEMYDKYKGLPDDMQEDIDELVQAFQEQRDALRDTENELLNYADAMKEAREEIVDLIEETEDLILETIQDREEVLHNARIKALEDEIEMIEEAVEARNDAREEQDNAEDLFNAQEALRRATLDSSGKNNATLLQLQQDLEDKQQEISEKRFEEDMDTRKEYLQAIIDAENETYDYRLETMTWYWEQVEEMQTQSTEVIMKFLMTWNEEYLKESQFGQERLMEQWQTTFDELNTLMQDEMTDNINDLKSKFLDLASGVEAIDVNVQALAGTWDKVTQSANNAANAMKNASSYKGTAGGGKDSTKDTSDDDLNGKVSSIFDDMDSKESWVSVRSAEGYSVGATVAVEKNAPTYDLWGKKTGSLYGGLNGAIEEIITNGDDYWVRLKGDKKRFFSIDDITSTYVSSISTQTPTYRPAYAPALRYARGGLVDYTGPAWVDGSTTNPEAFLSSYQTEQIGALAKALDSSSVNTVSNSSNVTFGTITFNVASMSSAADGRKALDTFVKGANEMMAKKGVNTTLNLNYK